ncbi:hypothetical protein BPAE_0164g00110 [Botrytis paeoniae]|uniref:Uncharacterized protein n=1 Tax=Botrytis paeoniae TaxID=278948 RepID=A0A4Z1FCF3_9HELO|nr:hypothetical protein BPAE_0164g00110 [Botrytis paeoniae]
MESRVPTAPISLSTPNGIIQATSSPDTPLDRGTSIERGREKGAVDRCSYTPLMSRGRKKKRPHLDSDPLEETQDPGLRDDSTASPVVIRPGTHRPLVIDNNGSLAVKRR